MKIKLNIINVSGLMPFFDLGSGSCLDVIATEEATNKPKSVRFRISGIDRSIIKSDEKIIQQANDEISSGIISDFEFDNVSYFEYTGSHFQQLQEKPIWANSPYRTNNLDY